MFGGAPFQVIHNAIDTLAYRYDAASRSAMRQQLGLSEELTIGHVGRFNPPKNHPFLLEIFAALLKREPNAVLLLVGGGDDLPKIQAKAQALGISGRVRFLGVRSDVADLMQAMDVFVFPSLYEGLGIVLIEAQAAGLPCVVSETIPPEAYLTDLVFPECLSSSADTWADKILALRATPRTDRRPEIAAHGFDIVSEAEKLQEFYLAAYEKSR